QSHYRISVKREDDGEQKPGGKVSQYLHNSINEGDTIELSAPAGDFTLDLNDHRPVVLISGGVGLTPMVSMLNTIVETTPERSVTFIHAARNSEVHAMKKAISELAEDKSQVKVYWCYSEPTAEDVRNKSFDKEGFITADWLKEITPGTDAVYYFCGPVPFMKEVNSALRALQVPADQVHYEFFGPAGSLELDDCFVDCSLHKRLTVSRLKPMN